MILHPGILALLAGSAATLLMLLYASGTSVAVARRWDGDSSSSGQLALERKTWLLSSIMNLVLPIEILSVALFLYVAEDLHVYFTGAMCATGTLNAGAGGWSALAMKVVTFFALALWVALNMVDLRTEDSPLVRVKYAVLPALALLAGISLFLQVKFFLSLDPAIITSCCGALFSEDGGTVAAELAGLPAGATMMIFYPAAALGVILAAACLFHRAPFLRGLLALWAALFFGLALVSVVAFISLYYYELPTHHCPFDILQSDYGFVGYPLYGFLFGGTVFALLPGLSVPLRRNASLDAAVAALERRWLAAAILFLSLFTAVASWPVVTGDFSLF